MQHVSTLTFRVEQADRVIEIEARSRESGKPDGPGSAYALQLRYLTDGLRLSAKTDAGLADLERFGVDLLQFRLPGTAHCELKGADGRIRLHRPSAGADVVLDLECRDRSLPNQVRVSGVAVAPADIQRLQAWCRDLTRRH